MMDLYPTWMAMTSLIRQGTAEVNALMGARDVLVDVTLAATDGGWGGGSGGTPTIAPVGVAFAGGAPAKERIVYREPPWPIVKIRQILSKDERDRVKIFIREMIEV